ncbi:MAG: DUF2298 domain-containing protein [Clostridiales bacterium]|nr:DUF2298 domain-containing protein [Clostridiales bacterium]
MKQLKNPLLMKVLPQAVIWLLLMGLSAYLLHGDVWTFWTWWLLAAFMGMVAMPVTGQLFQNFDDKGWLFSKVLAILVTGFLTWFLVSIKVLPFTTASCIGVSVACGVLCFFLYRNQLKNGIDCFPEGQLSLILWEEVLFFALFLMWTYLAGFNPKAYGTEKFMDYGFMEAMMRSTTLPAADLWYSESTINYYYGGQYFAVFLTKLTGSKVEITYNLMRTFVAGFAFVLPFSLVRQMTKDRMSGRLSGNQRLLPAISGLVAGTAVSIAGNMHYVIYRWILPWITTLTGGEVTDSYWFPDATRYIGYNPETSDKTIHEFPCYSFVLGDLHAHVVNILFVLPLIALLYTWHKRYRRGKRGEVSMDWAFWKQELLMPHLLLLAVMLGMFQWTNYWDFIIYFVVVGGTVLFTNIIRFEGRVKRILAVTAAQAVELAVISCLVILPFTLQFETMVQGVALAQNHSLPYQLLILWGLPTLLVLLLIVSILIEKLKGKKNQNVYTFMEAIAPPDLFAVILGLCAIGLVVIPELVYVRDIYENGNARANTMFKLTYQAYIMFGMTTGYGIFRLLKISRQKLVKALAGVCLFFWVWTVGYFGNSVSSWFGDVLDPDGYQGLNATAFLETEFAEDAAGIRWLKENIEGSPVVLEANGDSYTGYQRVSAMTGLPTVLGWYVHEWLWRNDTADLNEKSADVQSIYTSLDEDYVRQLLDQYDVEYIFVGSKEREKYGEALNEEMLKSLGTVVFQDEIYDTYIIQIGE